MKLAEWARTNGVHPQTAYRWFREDRLPAPARRLESGTIWVDAVPAAESGRVVVYARVSSHDQRRDLDRQVARLTEWATGSGHAVGEVVTEVGSGLNGKRPKLRRILSDPSASVVVVEHRDRLARFGVEHLEAAFAAHGRKIVVADPGETTDDLVRVFRPPRLRFYVHVRLLIGSNQAPARPPVPACTCDGPGVYLWSTPTGFVRRCREPI